MGIADRDYYRGNGSGGGGRRAMPRPSFRPGQLSIISWIILINVAIFGVDLLLPMVDIQDVTEVSTTASQAQFDRAIAIEVASPGKGQPGVPWMKNIVDPTTGEVIAKEHYRSWHMLNGYGHFSLLKGFMSLEVWRVVTYQFLHANLSHLFFNMFGLFMFGGMVEQYLGRKKFLSFYLLCGICGGLLYLTLVGLGALGLNLPGTLGLTTMGTPLIGASAGVFGVIVACAKIQPEAKVMLLFPPIPLRLKWLAYGYVGIAAFNLITGGNNAGGDAAHLGGAFAGFYFIRNIHLLRGFLDFGIGPAPANAGGHPRPGPPKAGGRLDKQADKILEKVHAKGIHSLTDREKKILAKSSKNL